MSIIACVLINYRRLACLDVRAHSLDPRGGRLLGGDASLQMSNFEFDDTDGKAPIFCNKYAIDEMDNIRPINNDPAGGRRGSLDFQHRMASGVNRLLDPLEDDEDEDDERSFRGASQQPPPHQRNPSPTHHPQQQHQSNAEYYANHHQHDTARRQSQSQRSSQPHQLYRPADEREDDFDMHPIRQNKRRERPRECTPNMQIIVVEGGKLTFRNASNNCLVLHMSLFVAPIARIISIHCFNIHTTSQHQCRRRAS